MTVVQMCFYNRDDFEGMKGICEKSFCEGLETICELSLLFSLEEYEPGISDDRAQCERELK